MVLISYDIADNKKRTKFYRYLKRYGHRLQFSVFQIENSERILKNIIHDITNVWEKEFGEEDSVYIFTIDDKNVQRFGYAKNEISDIIIV